MNRFSQENANERMIFPGIAGNLASRETSVSGFAFCVAPTRIAGIANQGINIPRSPNAINRNSRYALRFGSFSRGSARALRASTPCSAAHRLRLLDRQTQGQAKAQFAAPARRVEAVTDRRPAVPGGVEPAAAPEHPVRACCCAGRIARGRRSIIRRIIPF